MDSLEELTDSASDDEPEAWLVSSTAEGPLPPAPQDAEESDDDAEDDERVRRIGLAARRLMLGRQEDDDAEDDERVMRIGLAARRLMLDRQEDDDGELFANSSWSSQSTDFPASDIDSFEELTDSASDDEPEAWLVSSVAEGPLPPALQAAEESDDDAEDDERARRIGLAARRLVLGRQEDDDGEVSEAELERACQRMGLAARRLAQDRPKSATTATADDDDVDSGEACMRIRLAARRLALGRQEDGDGEVSDAEVEAAAARMGALSRRYALTAGRSC